MKSTFLGYTIRVRTIERVWDLFFLLILEGDESWAGGHIVVRIDVCDPRPGASGLARLRPSPSTQAQTSFAFYTNNSLSATTSPTLICTHAARVGVSAL